MQRWEYMTISLSEARLNRVSRELNQLGDQGWEVVSTWEMRTGVRSVELGVLLKRPLVGESHNVLPQVHSHGA